MLINLLKSIIYKEKYNPGFIGLFINPFYFARKGLYTYISSFSSYISGKILDVGCGEKPYESLFDCSEYVGLEIQDSKYGNFKKADYYYDGEAFPFDDNEFDSILVNQVLEHVFNPTVFLSEVHRVLKHGGILLITVPFIWDEHEQPYDFARYSSFGLKHIIDSQGFEVLHQEKSLADVRVIFQVFAGYMYKILSTKINILNMILTIFFIAPINIAGVVFGMFFPKNQDLYLDNIIIAKKT